MNTFVHIYAVQTMSLWGKGGGRASITVNKYNFVVGLNPIEIVTKICTFFSCLHVVVVFFTCVEIMLVCYSFVVHIFA